MMSFFAKLSERSAIGFRAATGRLDWFARWSRAKALRVPMGADLAGDEWNEPTLLPIAPQPPPIPPAAFFKSRPTPAPDAPDEDWAAAILAAKHGATPPPSPSPSEGSGAAPLPAPKQAAKPAAQPPQLPAPRPQPTTPKLATPRPLPTTPKLATARPLPTTPKLATPRPQETRPALKPLVPPRGAELRVGPKPVAPRAVEPHMSLRAAAPFGPPSDIAPKKKPAASSVDANVAAATRKAVATALRS